MSDSNDINDKGTGDDIEDAEGHRMVFVDDGSGTGDAEGNDTEGHLAVS